MNKKLAERIYDEFYGDTGSERFHTAAVNEIAEWLRDENVDEEIESLVSKWEEYANQA
jgi:hypothetical protein